MFHGRRNNPIRLLKASSRCVLETVICKRHGACVTECLVRFPSKPPNGFWNVFDEIPGKIKYRRAVYAICNRWPFTVVVRQNPDFRRDSARDGVPARGTSPPLPRTRACFFTRVVGRFKAECSYRKRRDTQTRNHNGPVSNRYTVTMCGHLLSRKGNRKFSKGYAVEVNN